MSLPGENPLFNYEQKDLYEFEPNQYEMTLILSLVLAIEKAKPGTLLHMLYVIALTADEECGWTINSNDPKWALKQQSQLHSWLVSETEKLKLTWEQDYQKEHPHG